MVIRPLQSAKTILRTFDTTGTTPPTGVRAEIDIAIRIVGLARNGLGRPPADLNDALYAALEEGRDPAADPDIQTLVTARAIANDGTTQAVEKEAGRRVTAAIRENENAIIEAWRAPFAAAVADLLDAAAILGDIDLTDTTAVVNGGGQSTDAWATATKAQAVVTAIVEGWAAVVRITGSAPEDNRHRVLRMATATLEQWQRHELAGAAVTPWDSVRLGLTLNLPTPSEYLARVAYMTDAQRRQDEAEQREAGDWASGRLAHLLG